MLGVGVFFGDRDGIGRTFQQVANGSLPSIAAARFARETTGAGPFRDIVSVYAQANLLQIMQCTACNALHNVTQRCCRWLLQTRDRVDDDTFSLKQEFLSVMLGVHRPTVTVVLRALQRDGLISGRYGRISIVERKRLEAASCECYSVIRPISYGSGCSERRREGLIGRAVTLQREARDGPGLFAIAATPQRRHGDDLCQRVDHPAFAEWTVGLAGHGPGEQ